MSYDMKVEGTLHFLTEDEIDLANREVEEIMAVDDPDFAEIWRAEKPVKREGLAVHIAIEIGAPPDWWFLLEAIFETYADLAEAGKIESWYDGEENESYGPDAE